MKLIAIILIFSTITCFINFQNEPVVNRNDDSLNWFQISAQDQFAQNKGSKYDHCLNQVDDVAHFSINLLRMIFDGQFDKTLPKIAMLIQYTKITIQCFKNAKDDTEVLSMDPQCALDHLYKASSLLKDVIKDILTLNYKMVSIHWQEMIVVLNDTKNC